MLRLYYGRENLNKDRFLFEQIQKSLVQAEEAGVGARRIVLLVPDQFTLQAEQNAFYYLDALGLIDLEVLSQSRLAEQVFSECGGSKKTFIDRYGRHMLLSKIIREEEHIVAFSGVKKSQAFIELLNDFITEMKQYNGDEEQIARALSLVPKESLLYSKLSDMQKIVARYEEALQGKYMDTEDFLALFIQKIAQSGRIRKTEFWVFGFDSFTEKSLLVLQQLMLYSCDINVVMTADHEFGAEQLFSLPSQVMGRLCQLAEAVGVSWAKESISCDLYLDGRKAEELLHLERELYAFPQKVYRAAAPGVHFCLCANFYAEAETAATQICRLVLERGFRYRDIAVICNDMEERGSVIKRVFSEYGIPTFMDEKRRVESNPAVELVLALLSTVRNGWLYEDVFRLLKTGLFSADEGIGSAQYASLENYCIQYKIRGSLWRREFRYGVNQEGEEVLAGLNEQREILANLILDFESPFKKAETVRQKTEVLYVFLQERLGLSKKLEKVGELLHGRGEHEAGGQMDQIWGVIVSLMDQMVELLGEEKPELSEYEALFLTGFRALEIGLLPPTLDQVVVGTMQRTRTGAIKALLVLGANDGILPAAGNLEALLSEDEKKVLLKNGVVLCANEERRTQEERLAIYKNLSKPTEYLYLSYSAADAEGREIKASLIYDKLRKLFPKALEERDIFNREDVALQIEVPGSAIKHLTRALRQALDGEELPLPFMGAYHWFFEEEKKERGADEKAQWSLAFSSARTGLFYTNEAERLERTLVSKLYKKDGWQDFILSPSRLERFGRCPFAHFVQYGLAPQERRIFEVAGREVGDVYHQCLMRLCMDLTGEGVELTAPDSPWMTVREEDCRARVKHLMGEIAEEYRDGMLSSGEEERYRAGRMEKVCGDAAWALISHVQAGRIKDVYFEAAFGSQKEKPFPPIEIQVDGGRVLIEGKIDRVDVIAAKGEAENTAYVKIIDYKSGKEHFDIEEAKSGWRLQLMLYLQAAMEGVSKKLNAVRDSEEKEGTGKVVDGTQVKPAGVFYFEIAEPMIDAGGFSDEDYLEKVRDKLERSFKLDGILLDDPQAISGMDSEFTGISRILPIRRSKEGTVSATGQNKLLDEPAFTAFREQVSEVIQSLCTQILAGDIHIRPKKTEETTACRFCNFSGICHFDTAFSGCTYEKI